MLGGGSFTIQNKTMPGTYINFVSTASTGIDANERGYAAMALPLDWGEDGNVFTVTYEDFRDKSLELFGYKATHKKLAGIRDLFRNAQVLYAYKLTSGGEKASNSFAQARYSGVRGNDIKTVIQKNVEDDALFDVSTYLEDILVDSQTVANAGELISNQFVTFKADATLATTANTPLTGGTNGTATIEDHQNFLDQMEAYSCNAIGLVSNTEELKKLYAAYTKRMRDEHGVKFQTVLYQLAADYEGVVNVKNTVTNADEAALVYWVTGVIAGTAVNASSMNKIYDGEYAIDVNYTQTQLAASIKDGEYILHRVNDSIRVLDDVNSLTTISETKGEMFKDNFTIRVIDQIATDVSAIFADKYLGKVPNDEAGREALRADVVENLQVLSNMRAIENFDNESVAVTVGSSKKSVMISCAISIINVAGILYMTVAVA